VGHISLLLVEDNPDVLEMFQLMLEGEGFAVTAAADAEQALRVLETFRPAIIITDLMMPKMSGLEFIRHVRQTPELAAIPVVAMTAFDYSHLWEAKQAGATAGVRKPIEVDDLMTLLNGICSNRLAGGKGVEE
jgi:CheY-like chemotaxis protein